MIGQAPSTSSLRQAQDKRDKFRAPLQLLSAGLNCGEFGDGGTETLFGDVHVLRHEELGFLVPAEIQIELPPQHPLGEVALKERRLQALAPGLSGVQRGSGLAGVLGTATPRGMGRVSRRLPGRAHGALVARGGPPARLVLGQLAHPGALPLLVLVVTLAIAGKRRTR